jgi:hypothetical protein
MFLSLKFLDDGVISSENQVLCWASRQSYSRNMEDENRNEFRNILGFKM